MYTQLEQTTRRIIAEELSVTDSMMTDDATYDDLGADSLTKIQLVMALEEEFEIDIPEEELESIQTVGSTIEYVKRLAG